MLAIGLNFPILDTDNLKRPSFCKGAKRRGSKCGETQRGQHCRQIQGSHKALSSPLPLIVNFAAFCTSRLVYYLFWHELEIEKVTWIIYCFAEKMSDPISTTTPNGGASDKNFKYDPNSKTFPARKELPQLEGTPPGAWVTHLRTNKLSKIAKS